MTEGLRADESSDEAAEGTTLHSATKPTISLEGLNDEQRHAVDNARTYAADKLAGASKVLYEETMVLWGEDNEPVTWGTCDIVGIYPSEVRIVENKFGRIPVGTDTVELQARAYAGAAMQEFAVPRAAVWVYQPREETEFIGTYSHPEKIADEIQKIINIAFEHPEILRPSATACRYCRGKSICPEFREEVMNVLPATKESLAVLDPTKVAKALEFAQMIEPWAKAVRNHAREMIQEGTEIPGWTLAQRTLRQVANVCEAFNAVGDILTQEEFLECAEVRIGDLEDKYSHKWKELNQDGSTLKAGKERFKDRTKGAVIVIPQSYLKRKE